MMSYYAQPNNHAEGLPLVDLPVITYSLHSQLPCISVGRLLHPHPEDMPCSDDKGQTTHGVDLL